jgi:5-methylcytosine-specific restriction endonuclease McrA
MSDEERKRRARERALRWRLANPERAKANSQKHAREGREAAASRAREWYQKNHERALAYRKMRRETLHDQTRFSVRTSTAKARTLDRSGRFSKAEWDSMVVSLGSCCAYCGAFGVPLQIEHVIPTSSGGKHRAENILPACGPCNQSKKNRSLGEWLDHRKSA